MQAWSGAGKGEYAACQAKSEWVHSATLQHLHTMGTCIQNMPANHVLTEDIHHQVCSTLHDLHAIIPMALGAACYSLSLLCLFALVPPNPHILWLRR